MHPVSQAQARPRPLGMLLLTIQGLVGVVALVQTVVSASSSGVSVATLMSDNAFRTGFLTIAVAAALSLILALAYWLVQRWTVWLVLLAELVALLFGVIAITGNLLDWYSLPVFVVLPALILVDLFADRHVRASRKRVA